MGSASSAGAAAPGIRVRWLAQPPPGVLARCLLEVDSADLELRQQADSAGSSYASRRIWPVSSHARIRREVLAYCLLGRVFGSFSRPPELA